MWGRVCDLQRSCNVQIAAERDTSVTWTGLAIVVIGACTGYRFHVGALLPVIVVLALAGAMRGLAQGDPGSTVAIDVARVVVLLNAGFLLGAGAREMLTGDSRAPAPRRPSRSTADLKAAAPRSSQHPQAALPD